MRRFAKRLVFLLAPLALSSVASAYYHWIFFPGKNGPFTPVPEKFDLNALADGHTVSYFISDQGPGPLMPGDNLEAIVSQIRLAASVWNGVQSSDLRLAFGGISSMSTLQSSPGIDIVFDDDMPPGLLAQSKPMTVADTSFVANGAPFVPIVRSKLQLRKDLTANQQASYSDAFFLTIVHEFGHTLGLQHSLTSGVMSTAITRATTKAKPLSADDIAGVSLLYPTAGFLASTGSISGRVILSGAGVNLASVVAISTSGVAVSGMSNPDGTYRIDGIPPGSYYVYAHPLPPAVQGEAYPDNIVPPQDPFNNPFSANTGIDSQFYPGTRDWTQAATVNITAGNTASAINFSMQKRNGPTLYDMVTYVPQGPASHQSLVQAGPIQSGTRNWLAFFAYGTVGNNNQLAPGLNVSVLGGSAQVEPGSVQYWTSGYLLAILDTATVANDTPTALVVTVNNDMYVLPAALTVSPSGPPSITSVTAGTDGQGNPTATVTGANFGTGPQVLFDGARGSIVNVNSDGSLVVSAPPAAGGHKAAIEILTADTQTTSQALGASQPPTFSYPGLSTPSIDVKLSGVNAGTDRMVEIAGFNTNFVDGRTFAGFGSSDIAVRQTWVTGPNRLLVNVSVNAAAPATASSVSVATALQLSSLTTNLQILPAVGGQISLRTPIVSAVTQLNGVPLGGTALINASGLPQSLAGWALTIGGQQASMSLGSPGQIRAVVPSGLVSGPAVVQLTAPDGTMTPPVLMQVDPPPPAITAATSNTVKAGDTVTLTVFGLGDSNNVLPAASAVRVTVGGITVTAQTITLQGNAAMVQFVVPGGVASGAQTVTVAVGTRVSSEYSLNVQ